MQKAVMPETWMLDLLGKTVVVTAELTRTSGDSVWSWVTVEAKPRAGRLPVGWVVGFRWLLQGKRIPGTSAGWGIDSWDPGEPATFMETGKRTPCLLVSYWPTMLPVRVPLDGFRLADNVFEYPVAPSRTTQWNALDRKLYRELAAEIPRDHKGRFVAKGK